MPTPTLFTPRLTSAELRVLSLAAAGWEAPELGLLTGVEPPALAHLAGKLGAGTLDEAVDVATALGIVRRPA